MIGGKECVPRPLGIRELTEVERDCLDRYKRQYLETYSRNLDLLPEAERVGVMAAKLDEVSRWDIDDLPPKHAHDPDRIRLTDGLKAWLTDTWGVEVGLADPRLRRLAAAALDQDVLTGATYERLANAKPPRVKVPYVHWWITGAYDGMITLIWACFRNSGVTREQVVESLGGNMTVLSELSRDIEKLSAPAAGNG